MNQANSSKTVAHVIYGLYAASCFIAFLIVIAVIVNYVKRDDVAGSWLESHFTWQRRTFWWGLLWAVIGLLTLKLIVGFAVLVAAFVWYLYRVIKGWLWLNDNKPMYESGLDV